MAPRPVCISPACLCSVRVPPDKGASVPTGPVHLMTGVPAKHPPWPGALPALLPPSPQAVIWEGPQTSSSRDRTPTRPGKHRVPERKTVGPWLVCPVPQRGCCHTSQAAGNGLVQLAARATARFPSGPFPLSGCFALNSQSSAFPSPPFPPFPHPKWSRTDTLLHFRASRSLPPPSPLFPPPHSRPLPAPAACSAEGESHPMAPPAGRAWEHHPTALPCSTSVGGLSVPSPPRCGPGRPGPTGGRRREVEPGRSTSSVYWGLAWSRGRAPSGTSSPGGHCLQSQALGRVRAAAREGLFLSPARSGC